MSNWRPCPLTCPRASVPVGKTHLIWIGCTVCQGGGEGMAVCARATEAGHFSQVSAKLHDVLKAGRRRVMTGVSAWEALARGSAALHSCPAEGASAELSSRYTVSLKTELRHSRLASKSLSPPSPAWLAPLLPWPRPSSCAIQPCYGCSLEESESTEKTRAKTPP